MFVVAAFAFAVRALGWASVFVEGRVVFAPADAMYHVRRSLYMLENWPSALLWDSYINYPDGAAISWPPLFDFANASVAMLLSSDVAGFERVLAWAPPVYGALTALPLYWTGRALASRGVGIAAALLFGALPICVAYGRVGNPDHHVAVACLGAWLLSLVLAWLAPDARARSLRSLAIALALGRAALLLTWHGSLLYLGLLDGVLVVAALLQGRREWLGAQAASALGTLALVAPLSASFPTPLGGAWSSIGLSNLHLAAVLGVALVCSGSWVLARTRPRAPLHLRLALALGLGLGALGLVLAFPAPRAGIAPALLFLTMTDAAGAATAEQFPLLEWFARSTRATAQHVYGGFRYAIPLAPLAALSLALGRRERRAQALALAAWCALFGALALGQRRYANDLAPAFALSMALGAGALIHAARRRVRVPTAAGWSGAALAAAALLWAPVQELYAPWALQGVRSLRGEAAEVRTPAWSLYRFAEAVRAATPATRGWLDVSQTPEYGVVAHANLGHALHYVARRATPTDPFWSYIGPDNWERAFALLAARDEAEALRLAGELRARYVVTMPGGESGTLQERLHRGDGATAPRLQRFRLVTEGPRGGVALGAIFRHRRSPSSAAPYKLFEVVEGAVVEVSAEPGAAVEAELEIDTLTGRRFQYRARARADRRGIARMRVPYASGAKGEVRTALVWTISTDDSRTALRVSDDDVRAGHTLQVALEGG